MDDEKVIERIAVGEPDAVGQLYDRYAGVVLSLAQRILREGTLAAEATQDVFVQVWRDAARYDPSRGSVKAWLLTIARARALDRLRASRSGLARLTVRAEHGEDVCAARWALIGDWVRREQHASVATVLKWLPAPDRTVIHLAYVEGCTHVEIAQRLGRPLGSVKTHLRRVLGLLRTAVGQHAEWPLAWRTWSTRPSEPCPPSALGGLDVLVVDDDPDTLRLVALVLRRAGAVVHVAGSARQALRQLQQCWPDMLLTDIGMPERDGYALLHSIRQLPDSRAAHLPAVAFTALDGPAEQLRVRAAGFTAHIGKPVRPSILVQRLRELVPPDAHPAASAAAS